jgi:hypothetical protein
MAPMSQFCPVCGNLIPTAAAGQASARCSRCGNVIDPKAASSQPPPVSFPPFGPPPAAGYAPAQPPSNPYQAPSPWADNFYAPGYFQFADRGRALQKIKGPAVLMIVYGTLLALGGVVLACCIPFMVADMNRDEQPVMTVVLGVSSFLCIASGGFIFWAALRMLKLRSYGLAMTAVVFTFIIGFLACLPVMLVGIWPLVVLLDAEVKACFDRPEASIGG